MQVQRTRTTRTKWMAWVMALAVTAGGVSTIATEGDGSQEPAPASGGVAADGAVTRTLRADVVIRQEWLDERGTVLPALSRALRYRLDQSIAQAGWRTSLRVIAADASAALADPFAIAEMVHDERRGLRLFNGQGDQVPLPAPVDRRLLRDTGEVPRSIEVDDALDRAAAASRGRRAPPTRASRLVVERGAAAERTAELRAVLGEPVERTPGFDWHVVARAGGMTEVVVDTAAGLPVEINVVRDGVLVARTRLGYDAIAGDLLVRRRSLTERAAPGGGRLVTDVELSHVEVTAGGVR